MKRNITWVSVLLAGVLIASCGGGDKAAPAKGGSQGTGAAQGAGTTGAKTDAIEIKLDMTVGSESSWYQAAKRFKDQVEQRTNGKITVSLHPDGELAGKDLAKSVELLRAGTIDMSMVSVLPLSNVDPKLSAIPLPWMIPSYAAADKFRTSPVAQELLDSLKTAGLVGLAWGEAGFRQLTNAKHPVAKPEDLADLQIRVPNVKLYLSVWKALGKEPKVFNWADVPAKIKEGAIDGQENPIDLIMSAKLYEVQSQISLWNYSYDAIAFAMSEKTWQKFDAATQEIIRQAAKDAANYQVQLSRGTAMSQVKFLKDKGMTVTELAPEQITAFRNKVVPVYSEYESIVGKDTLDKLRGLSA